MFSSTSITIGYSSTEIRPTRTLRGSDGERQTVRVRPGRGNQKRAAIRASLGYGR